MALKTGGGNKPENYDPNTGKYVDSEAGSQSELKPILNTLQAVKIKFDLADIQNFMKSKEENNPQQSQGNLIPDPGISVAQAIYKHSWKIFANPDIMLDCINSGTEDAKRIVANLLENTTLKIVRGDGAFTELFNQIELYSDAVEDLDPTRPKGEVFFHELFHGLDANLGAILDKNIKLHETTGLIRPQFVSVPNSFFPEAKALTEFLVLENGKTFTDILREEYTSKYWTVRYGLSNAGKQNLADLFQNESDLIKNSKSRKERADYFSVLGDAMSGFTMNTWNCVSLCHKDSYWNVNKERRAAKSAAEMFAELGSLWCRGKTECIDLVAKYLPNSVKAFYSLMDKIGKELL